MPNDLAIQPSPSNTSREEVPIRLPKVALRVLRRERRDFESLFGVSDLPLARLRLREQLRHQGFRESVLNALDLVPRHVFVSTKTALAYVDIALEDRRAFVHAPSKVATVVSTLHSSTAKVLELGTGSGYQSAVLAAFGADVTTIDASDSRHQAARERFSILGLNVQTLTRENDAMEGLDPASFDLIVVNEMLRQAPRRLLGYLRDGGRTVVPMLMADSTTRLISYQQRSSALAVVDLGPCAAPGKQKEARTC